MSLLARIELAGGDVCGRWQALAPRLAPRVHDHVQPFLDMHYLYGLARAGRPEADTLLASIEAHAVRVPEAAREAWLGVAVPACRGLLAHARGDADAAVRGLCEALPRLVEIGGSHAQRDLFEQIRVDALMASGRWTAAQHLLQPAANAQPASRRIASRLRRTYRALGLIGAIGA